MRTRWAGMPPCVKSGNSCRSWSPKCSWMAHIRSSAASRSPGISFTRCSMLCSNRYLEAMLLKPNMVLAGKNCSRQASVPEVATATLRCLRRHVPAAVPGIVFLSGGQSARLATAHLNAINQLPGPKPWKISFSYGRALQDPALEAWHGREDNLAAGQRALYHRGRSKGAACVGKWMRWRRHRKAPMIRGTAKNCPTTDTSSANT